MSYVYVYVGMYIHMYIFHVTWKNYGFLALKESVRINGNEKRALVERIDMHVSAVSVIR